MVAEPSWRGDPNAVCALGYDPEESAGLQRQAAELAPERRSWSGGGRRPPEPGRGRGGHGGRGGPAGGPGSWR